MNGQMKKYKESLKTTQYKVPDPALSKVKIDYTGLFAYAKFKGVQPGYLSDEEKNRFILNSDMASIKSYWN